MKDIIDVEGFIVDDLNTWKYIMIVAFLCKDIIVVNICSRFHEVKKIMGIIWNSLENLKQLQLPKILKTIWVQIDDNKYLPSFEEDMKSIDNSVEKWKDKEIDIKPLFLERKEKNQLKKAKNNILKVKP